MIDISSRWLRYAFPLLLILAGLWGMNGCYSVSTPEYAIDVKQKDFRRILLPLDAPRSAILSLLGPPSMGSTDGRIWVYFLDMKQGLYVGPLCFGLYHDVHTIYALVLTFDAQGRLAITRTTESNDPDESAKVPKEQFIRDQIPELYSVPREGRDGTAPPAATTR